MVHLQNASGPGRSRKFQETSRTDREFLLTTVLRGVSRAFYLTLRVLPASLREPVGLAYLLARTADTVADARSCAPADRLELLLRLREQIEGPAAADAIESVGRSMSGLKCSPLERQLLDRFPTTLAVLERLAESDRSRVRSVVRTLTSGMEIDLRTFPAEESGDVVALKSSDELDRYTYLVAGCVGEFWTGITVAHIPALGRWNLDHMSELGVRFGKALQMTNVLRDVPRDLRLGRCYLPADHLARHGVDPHELLDPLAAHRARPVLVEGIATALDHFQAAESYLLAIPRRCRRLRLAALWPILIGLATLERLARNDEWLDPSQTARVSRGWVYRMMSASVPVAGSNGMLRGWVRRLRSRVQRAV